MYKVLIVEDDPMVAMINEQYINQHRRFRVVGKCRDGYAALDFLEQQSVDLLVLDVYMPRMDGFEVLRQVRGRQVTADAIMVTAANDRESLEEALRLGVVDYLVKPFTFDRFRMALDKFIAKNSALQEIGTLNQSSIDHIIDKSRKKSEELYPKGIQEKTLALVLNHLEQTSVWVTGDEIAEQTGLTGVTARRYLNYLVESGRIAGEMNYGTGGRPCMQYRLIR